MNRLIGLLIRRPRLNLFLLGVVTLFFMYGLSHLRFDTSLSAFVVRNDPDMTYYDQVKKIFDTDETLVIGFQPKDTFGRADLALVKDLSDKILATPYVRNVRSFTTANWITAVPPDGLVVKALVEKLPESPAESAAFKKIATTNYLYTKDLVSTDGRYAAFLVDIRNDSGHSHTKEVVEAIKKLLNETERRTGYRMHLAGDAIINRTLGEYMQRDFYVFIVPVFLLITVLLRLTMGRWRDTLVGLSCVMLSLIWSMGTISLLGKTINNVTVGISPIIFCIALENIYFICAAYYDFLKKTGSQKEAGRQGLKIILKPCFFTSLTTVVGFASLMINTIKPITDFGLLGSIAAAYAFVISIVLVPSAYLLMGVPADLGREKTFKINALPLITAITELIDKKRRFFWPVLFAVILVGVLGIFRLKVQTDHMEFFKKNSEVYQATQYIEKHLSGASNLEITVRTKEDGAIKDPAVLQEVDKLVQFVRHQEKIDKALSIVDFLKEMNRAIHDNDDAYYVLPDTRAAVAQYLLVYSMSSRRNDIEKDFVDYDYRLARIRCRMSEHNSQKILAMIARIKAFAAKEIPGDLEVHVTSYPVIYSNMVEAISRGQLNNILLVVISLLIASSIYFRSGWVGFLSLIPNIIPILFALSFMGWTGISLNVGTAMISGIAIGLAMDDTTHFFNRFIAEQPSYPDYLENMRHTYRLVGEAMIFSSIVMAASYLVLMLSQFKLTALFGFLCALTTLVALACDMLITPWILITFKPKFRRS